MFFLAAVMLTVAVCESTEVWLIDGAVTIHSAVIFNSTKLGACISIKTCFNDRAHWAVWTDLEEGEQLVFYDDASCTGKSVVTPTAPNGNINFFDQNVGMAGEVSAFKTWKEGMLDSPTKIVGFSTPEDTIDELLSVKPESLIANSECK
ncbi:hypothetical protein PF008_g21150 [Phytophthora fragariae]|uniref:Uncharacterized protein n=1 Tax=Phytophthora fragariae TaxID=53985 RepID=A0A6G0QXF6_9STRA|nr:hypothetical protein PF008_g21150 [Phytophthora fragariae]